MRKKERERLSDFGEGADGKIAYLGDHVRLAPGQDRVRLLRTLWATCAVAVVAQVAAGVCNPSGMSGCPYVVMPYMLQLVALVSVVWAQARLSVAGERVRVYVRDETAARLPRRALLAAALGLVAAVGEVVFLATGGGAWGATEVAFLALEVAAVGALVAQRSVAARLTWEAA